MYAVALVSVTISKLSANFFRSNTDLGDQDCQLTIVKCINIPLPSGKHSLHSLNNPYIPYTFYHPRFSNFKIIMNITQKLNKMLLLR